MRYLSACSGIEAASVAWTGLGFEPVAFAEIAAFPSAVLAAHYPAVPNWGDITLCKGWPDANVAILVGGTPCQSFSVAGLRKGMDDPRGNLALGFLAIAARYSPRWLLWENVPGIFSDDAGAFGTFLCALSELGYGFAYRVLDAQYFGVPQRRRRVYVVAHIGNWRPAVAVLFERESLSGNPAPRCEAPEGRNTADAAGGIGSDSGDDACVDDGFDADGIARTAWALQERDAKGSDSDTKHGHLIPVAFADVSDPIAANQARTYTREGSNNFRVSNVATQGLRVRRLTPRECERLQGFPDDYTLIQFRGKPAKDAPRYRALGNSMPVPVMRWIGERVALVDALLGEHA